MKIKLFIISFLFGALGYAQTAITQNIRGRVIDQQSETPLPGVNVLVLEEGTSKGAVSDVDGYYVIQGVPVGRVVAVGETGVRVAPFADPDRLEFVELMETLDEPS